MLFFFIEEAVTTEYEGCFLDDIHDRDFIESTLWLEPQKMTVEACVDYCIALDHRYMGLQVSYTLGYIVQLLQFISNLCIQIDNSSV